MEALVNAISRIFTREYLNTNPVLVGKLDMNFFITLDELYKLSILSEITTDTQLILDAVRSCSSVVFEEESGKVGPKEKLIQRNTLIIREVPSGTSEQVFFKIFFFGETQLLHLCFSFNLINF